MQVVSRNYNHFQDNLLLKGIKDEETIEFISKSIEGKNVDRTAVLSVDNRFSIDNLHDLSGNDTQYSAILNLRKGNDIKHLTNFYGAVNEKLEVGGRFVTCVETALFRKERLYKKFPPIINSLYYFVDYLTKRVAPKLPVLRNIYFFITADRNRVLTSVEVLGRLVYCGFKIVETKKINNLLYITVEKEEDRKDVESKNYGFFFKMKRTGLNGKPIHVYKIRTMNAYSEYLQGYIYQTNSLDSGGKFKDDYRVNFMGNIFRKLWIDELPMIYNLLKGDIKLVGVRPLSQHYLSLYSNDIRLRRSKFKPGLVPPYYVDMPKTIDEIMASEMKYFEAYEKSPFLTDVKYFFKAAKNIIIKKARSK
ncbi:MAG: sugar transferase [Flavobacteriales bacterium]|nr:sugar transferase [Flavobacteriales bacterium]